MSLNKRRYPGWQLQKLWKQSFQRAADYLTATFLTILSAAVVCAVLKWLPDVCLLWEWSPFKDPSAHKMASDSPDANPSQLHTHTHLLSVTLETQWEVPAKRAAFVPVRVRLLFSRDLQPSETARPPSLLNHSAMDMLIWPSNIRQQLQNVLSAPYCEQVLNRASHRCGDNSIPWHLTRVCAQLEDQGPKADCSYKQAEDSTLSTVIYPKKKIINSIRAVSVNALIDIN